MSAGDEISWGDRESCPDDGSIAVEDSGERSLKGLETLGLGGLTLPFQGHFKVCLGTNLSYDGTQLALDFNTKFNFDVVGGGG